MEKNFIPAFHMPKALDDSAFSFIFNGENILVRHNKAHWEIPCFKDIKNLELQMSQQQYLGRYEAIQCLTAVVADDKPLPEGLSFEPIRVVYENIDHPDFFLLATRAKQILFWDKNTTFCGQCGGKTMLSDREPAKECTVCGALFYPHVSPAIMVLITRGNEILLARSPHFIQKRYSVIAGFVEPGETVEYAVQREVLEEVGLHVKNIRYVKSQPWPFPSNLMLGFVAEYESGEIKIDGVEIEDAHWYSIDNLPELPRKVSLARWLIDGFVDKIPSPIHGYRRQPKKDGKGTFA